MIADKILTALRAPIRQSEQDIYATGSIGVGVYPEDGTDADALMRSADVAMYKAKEAGRNTFRFYDAAMSHRAASRLSLETALRDALGRNEFRLHYQPVVDASELRRPVGSDHAAADALRPDQRDQLLSARSTSRNRDSASISTRATASSNSKLPVHVLPFSSQ